MPSISQSARSGMAGKLSGEYSKMPASSPKKIFSVKVAGIISSASQN